MKRKFFKILTVCLSVMMLVCSIPMFGCSNKLDDVVIFNHVLDSKVDLYDTVKIKLREHMDEAGVVFESSKKEVAVIENGSIVALSVGKTTIKATYGKEKQEQTIEVVDNGIKPEINFDNLTVLNGETVIVNPYVTYKGEIFEGATCSVKSENNSIVTVSGFSVTAKSIGEAQLTISAKWRGMDVASKTVSCSVSGNSGIGVGKHSYQLFVSDNVNGVNFTKQEKVTAIVNIDGVVVNDAKVTWVSGNENIATIDSNGMLLAVGVGETYIQGTYTADNIQIRTAKIPVVVDIPVLDTNDYLIVDLSTGAQIQTITGQEVFTIGDFSVGKIISDDGKVYSTDGKLELEQFKSGEYKCTIYNNEETAGVKLLLVAADMVVRTTQDFDKIGEKENLAKYIVIANDIDYSLGGPDGKGEYVTIGSHTDIENYFSGTLNGLGHSITNLKMKNSVGGLFKGSRGGTFKNFAMEVSLTKGNQAALFYYFRESPTIIENVYLDVTISGSSAEGGLYRPIDANGNVVSTGSAAICTHGLNGNLALRNCIIRVENKGDEGLKELCGAVMAYTSYGTAIFENSYVITDDFKISGTSNNSNNRFDEEMNRTPNIIYENDDVFFAARQREESIIDLLNFNHYWNLDGKVPQFKSFLN